MRFLIDTQLPLILAKFLSPSPYPPAALARAISASKPLR
jgi:predicted nuclease of predicted toxin-antitoxin system